MSIIADNVVATDSEFQPVLDEKTRPICVTLAAPGMKPAFYIHPRAADRVIDKSIEVGHEVFNSPCAIINYFNFKWFVATTEKSKHYKCFETEIFWSFKDLEFLFAVEADYREFLVDLKRTRRITSSRRVHTEKGSYMVHSVATKWIVQVPEKSNKDKMRWCRLSIQVIDISAMQGGESLANYAKNVGITMEAKATYTAEEKARMEDMYCEDPAKFKTYALGDAADLHPIREKTDEFYNRIAKLIGVESRDSWGMSTGKIVGSLLHAWIAKQLGLKIVTTGKNRVDELYDINCEAGAEGFTTTGKKVRDKRLNYTGGTDGGRAVKERIHNIYRALIKELVLADLDIDGCYGNGLRNQLYAVGTPTITNKRMSLREWLKKYGDNLIAGLWYARISWNDAPFKQDLLISKSEEAWQSWDWIMANPEPGSSDDDKKVYDASMVLTTKAVHQAALNHDLLQVIQKYGSNKEVKWLYDNAVIETSAMYLACHEVREVTAKMKAGNALSGDINVIVAGSKEWVRVDLKPLMDTLIKERKKYPKEDSAGNKIAENLPMNTFLKLIINTIYGCIASEFFSVPGSCVSNVVVGNNITARARTLCWAMAKGLHSAMSITDGGVFNPNTVLTFKATSLAIFEGLHEDKFTDSGRNRVVEQVSLFGRKIDYDEADRLRKTGEMDIAAWNHLKLIFSELDIFKYDQFSFATKDIYEKLTIHSKVDYRLVKPNGKSVIALRGMPKVWDEKANKKVVDPRAHILFDGIENDEPVRLDIASTELLSLADWERHPRKDELLPHDWLSKPIIYYSHTPLGKRFSTLEEAKLCQKEYDQKRNQAKGLPGMHPDSDAARKAGAELLAKMSRV